MKTEFWIKVTLLKNGNPQGSDTYEHNGNRLTEAEFKRYVRDNPQVETLIVHVLSTDVPLARSEKEVKEIY